MAEYELFITKKERKALKDCIKNWDGVVKGGYRQGCALCDIYGDKERCGKCPIKIWTGKSSCRGTSFYKWQNTLFDNRKKKDGRKYAEQMLNFLKDLLKRAKSL